MQTCDHETLFLLAHNASVALSSHTANCVCECYVPLICWSQRTLRMSLCVPSLSEGQYGRSAVCRDNSGPKNKENHIMMLTIVKLMREDAVNVVTSLNTNQFRK